MANGARGAGGEGNQGNLEMERKLLELSQREDVYELLARSLAPSIWEMDDVKKGILLQLFGGTNKSIAKGGGGGGPRYRGDINVLMVGDPGTSKSQILKVRHAESQILRVSRELKLTLSSLVWSLSTSTRSRLEGCTRPGRDHPLSV